MWSERDERGGRVAWVGAPTARMNSRAIRSRSSNGWRRPAFDLCCSNACSKNVFEGQGWGGFKGVSDKLAIDTRSQQARRKQHQRRRHARKGMEERKPVRCRLRCEGASRVP